MPEANQVSFELSGKKRTRNSATERKAISRTAPAGPRRTANESQSEDEALCQLFFIKAGGT